MNYKFYVLVLYVVVAFGGYSIAQGADDARPKTKASTSASTFPAKSSAPASIGNSAAKNPSHTSHETTEIPSLPPLAVFRTLDEETELLVKEVLDLSSDLAIIQEEEDNPAKHQLMVLVTIDPTKIFTLDYMQLEIDNEIVAAYQYSEQDIQALKRGAGHRLYVANLPAGMHEVFATMVGRVPRDPDYKNELSYKFVSGVSRTVLELNVASKNKGYPTINVKEWN
ncbi:hypothetical protein [Kaarinaea lacus]